jgi:hypothetical protein
MAAKRGPDVLFCMPNRTKCFLLLHLAPTMSATSAPRRAAERAALTLSGWESGNTPRPMDVERKGHPVAESSSRSAASACENAAPFPITSSGLWTGGHTGCSEGNRGFLECH